jgi:hypothetical protein
MTDEIIGDTGTDSVTNNATDSVAGNLILGNQASGDGSYTIDGDTAQTLVSFVAGGNSGAPVNVNDPNTNANGAVVIGNYGTGSFTQGSADNSDPNNQVSIAGDLVLGLQGLGNGGAGTDSAGTYTLNEGTLIVGGKLVVGASSTGTNGANLFTQNGGTVNLTGSAFGNPDYTGVGNTGTVDELMIGGGGGSIDGGTGAYILNNGTLTATLIEVGHTGTGTFTQNDGTVTATSSLWLGNYTGSTGTYTLSRGTLNAANEQVGIFGIGTFNQYAGSTNQCATWLSVNGYFSVTDTVDTPSVYNLYGGTLALMGSDQPGDGPNGQDAYVAAQLGNGSSNSGVINQTAGSATFGTPQGPDTAGSEGDVIIGAGGQGTYTLGDSTNQGPSATVYGSVIIGQNAGSNPLTTPGATPVAANLVVQGDGTNLGVFFNGGPSDTNPQSSNLIVGLNGNGAVKQTDGSSVYTDGAVVIGGNQGGTGSYNLSAGIDQSPTLSVGQNLDIGGIQEIPNGALGYFQAPGTLGGTGTFTQSGGTVNVVTDVNIGNNGGTGTYTLSGGSLTANTISLADGNYAAAVGAFDQSGGQVTTNALTIGSTGSNPNPQGYYTLTGNGTLTVKGNETISVFGYGSFSQGDGAGNTVHVVTGTLSVGDQAIISGDTQTYQREGIYTLTDGSLSTGTTIVGNQGLGVFNQSGGKDAVSGKLTLGAQNTPVVDIGGGETAGGLAEGTYDLSGGTLTTAGGLTVGDAGIGTLDQTGGTLQVNASAASVNQDLIVGAQAGSTGSYSLSGGGDATVSGNLIIGRDGASGGNPAATGTVTVGTPGASPDSTKLNVNDTLVVGSGGDGAFEQDSGTVASGWVSVAGGGGVDGGGIYPDGGIGTYTLTGGTLTASGIEAGHDGIGTIDQTVGTVNATWTLWVGNAGGSAGTYNLSGGLLTAGSGGEQIGLFGTGAFVQTGGTNADSNALRLASYGGGGSYTMTGGILTVAGDGSNNGITVGYGGDGAVSQSAGSVTSGVDGVARADLVIGAQSGTTSTYDLGDATNGLPTLQIYGNTILGRDTGATGGLAIAGDGTTLNVNQYTDFDSNNGGNIAVGLSGTGTVTQTGASTVYLDHNLVLGANAGAGGTYTLSATSVPSNANGGYNLVVGSDLDLGGMLTDIYGLNLQTTPTGGTGAFVQASGDIQTDGNLNVGNNGGTGTYTQSGGTATFGSEASIGNNGGTGTYTQSGGTVLVGGNGLLLGESAGAGTYYLSGPAGTALTITTGAFGYPSSLTVGDTGVGTFDQTGGAVIAGQSAGPGYFEAPNALFNVFIGTQANTLGTGDSTLASTYTLSSNDQTAPASLQVNGNLNLGVGAGAIGDLTVGTSGFVGTDLTSLNVDNDVWNPGLGGNILVGVNGAGTVTQYSGTVSAVNDVALGVNSGSSGDYTIDGGTLTTPTLEIGGSSIFESTITGGTGLFIQNGGSVSAGALGIGQFGGTGEYDLNGGTLNVTGVTYVSGDSTGTFKQSAGTFTANYLNVGLEGGGTGSYTLTGGTVTAGYLNVGGIDAQGTFTQSGSSAVQVGANLYVNDDGSSTTAGGSYTLSGGTLTVDGDAYIGNASGGTPGTGGAFTQTGGQVTLDTATSSLIIGNQAGDTGSYDLSSGILTVGGSTTVGEGGAGTFTQSGDATNNIDGTLTLGDQGGSKGLYTLTGGTLTTGITGGSSIGDVVIGNYGTGELDNSGGVQTSDSIEGFTLGWAGTGTYRLTGTGSLIVANNENIGGFGTGVFVQGDGNGTTSNTVSGSLYMSGGYGGSASSYTLTDGTLTVAGSEIVGFAAQGSFTQSGGTNAVSGDLTLGLLSNSADPTQFGAGTYTLGGTGALSVGGDLILGSAAGTTGAFNYDTAAGDAGSITSLGGTLVVGDAGTGTFTQGGGTLDLSGSGGGLDVGRSAGGVGTYDQTGGTLIDSAIIGDAGTGTYTNNGAIHTVNGYLALGAQATGDGTYDLENGGQLTVGSAAATGFADIGELGTGRFTQDGAASGTTIYGALDVGRFAGGTGTVNLDAGSLTVADGFAVVGDSGTGFFNQGGASTLTVGSGGLAIGRGESNAGGAPITGTGTYTLSGSASLTVTGGIALGVLAGNTGTFNQTGGSVIADNEIIGDGGIGQWNQNAGTNTVSGGIYIGLTNTGTYALAGGSVTAGSIAVDAQGSITGFGTIGGGAITDDGSISASTGDLSVNNDLTGSGLLSIGSGATLDLAGTVGALSLTFTAPGTPETLAVGQALGMDASITGFAASDLVVFSNLTFAGTDKIGSYAGGLLTIDNASDTTIATLTIAPPPSGSFQLTDSGGNLAVVDVVCFAAGTRILTDHGEVAVEALSAGDRVVTHDGATRPIVWIGQRRIDAASHPHPERVLPIRIRRGACAEQVPHNDLLVSPDHAICIDGQLIPARLLVNGATIYQDASVRDIRYFHVELDRHDVIVSEGLPSESYLDTGNRAMFANAGMALVLHPEFSIQERLQSWRADACAPLTVDEAHVRPIWQRLAERAGVGPDGLQHANSTTDPELRLLVNGQVLKPILLEGGRHLFAVSRLAGGQARLVSRSARPSDSKPWLDDGRRLGVAVQGVTLRGGDRLRHIPADHPDLRDGWWAAERAGAAYWRWTDGAAAISLPEGTEFVEVSIGGGMVYPLATVPEASRLAA